MNEKQAIELAKNAGLTVGKTRTRTEDSRKVRAIEIGDLTVYHDGRGGSGCWKISNHDQFCTYKGRAIAIAVELQEG